MSDAIGFSPKRGVKYEAAKNEENSNLKVKSQTENNLDGAIKKITDEHKNEEKQKLAGAFANNINNVYHSVV